MKDIEQYLESHQDQFVKDLCELLAIPSISASRRNAADMLRAARWIEAQFGSLGMAAELVETAGHPLVVAESPAVPGAPVVMVYGHYDVQPPDPLDQWISPPFEPTVRDGNIYARGATDDKGQMLTHVKSAQAWCQVRGKLPLQLKFLIEGEEEVGSRSLYTFLADERERLRCDVIVISDTCQFAPGQPAITYGLRGIAYYELRVSGPRQDLHSGSFGGAVTNPVNYLSRLLAALCDESGRIQLRGFYDDVVPLDDRERSEFAALAFDEQEFMGQIGVTGLSGEAGYSTLERRWARPTFDINGIWGGYQGEGEKTVLPSRAAAKFSFRLVPNQDPNQVTAALREFIAERAAPGIRCELVESHSAPGFVASLDSPYMAAATRAVAHGFGRAPVLIREGGSIPIVTAFHQILGADTLLLGWGLNDDNTHSPNEKFCLADFQRGIRASANLWHELSSAK